MESGVVRDRGIMRRDKKDHRNGNAEMRKEKRGTTGTVQEIRVCYFLLNSTARKLLMTKKV